MTNAIDLLPTYGSECDFVARAQINYDIADNIAKILHTNNRMSPASRRQNMGTLKNYLQAIEDNVWQALSRDFPKFQFRRQNQTIVINYSGTNNVVYINPGEVTKIKAWGVNDYYEALDAINRLQNQLWNAVQKLDRRWMDDWKRLGNQLNTIDRRNCKGLPEVKPGPTIILPPPCLPRPPAFPGPLLPIYPCPPIASQPTWSANDARNWSITSWGINPTYAGGEYNALVYTISPTIRIVDGRELIYFRNPGSTPTKCVWLFHGTGGSARSWFTDYEKLLYVKKFLDAGYMVAAYDSYNRISKKWTLTVTPSTNREIIGMKMCQNFLSTVGILPTSQFGVGMSSGGAMVHYAATELGFSKVIIHNAAGIGSVLQNTTYTAKTMWIVSDNDLLISNSEANDNYNWLLTNKPSTSPEYYIQQGTKITAAIFDAIPNISTVVAGAIVTGLYSNGFISNTGVLTSKYANAGRSLREDYLQNSIPALISTAFGNDNVTYSKYIKDIMDQIKISFSDHEFSGWVRSEVGGNIVLTDRDLAFLNS